MDLIVYLALLFCYVVIVLPLVQVKRPPVHSPNSDILQNIRVILSIAMFQKETLYFYRVIGQVLRS